MLKKLLVVVAFAVLPAVFLFTGRADAQNVRQFASPPIACKAYYNQQGFTIIRNLEHDCLVRNGDSQSGFLYTHYYDSDNNFCLEVTSSRGRIFGPQCIPISQTGREQQQQQDNPDKIS